MPVLCVCQHNLCNENRFSFLQVSTGTVQLNRTDEGLRDEQVVSASLHIANCINLNVTVRMTGNNASVSSQLLVEAMLAEVYGDKIFEDKSFALIYAHNETRSMDRIFRMGQRQTNDTLLKSDKIHVNNAMNNFPQHEIAFNDPTAFITQTEFTFNVSHSPIDLIVVAVSRIIIAGMQLNERTNTMHLKLFFRLKESILNRLSIFFFKFLF